MQKAFSIHLMSAANEHSENVLQNWGRRRMTEDSRPPCILCDTPTESIGEWEGVNYCLRHAALSYYFVPEATGMTRGSSELLEYLNELAAPRVRR